MWILKLLSILYRYTLMKQEKDFSVQLDLN